MSLTMSRSTKPGDAVGRPADDRGSVSVEYTVLLCLVALGCAAAVVALGPALVSTYELRLTLLLMPFP
jgi:Flp pilus assembly pilin Flp